MALRRRSSTFSLDKILTNVGENYVFIHLKHSLNYCLPEQHAWCLQTDLGINSQMFTIQTSYSVYKLVPSFPTHFFLQDFRIFTCTTIK